MTNYHDSFLRPPNFSEDSSVTISDHSHMIRQPDLNPLDRFLHRSEATCPTHFQGSTRTKWLKTGRKARRNQFIRSTQPPFHWNESNYGSPIHIHRNTSLVTIQLTMQKIANINLYTIDTESDPSPRNIHNPKPALIQIQAIHSETSATLILVEVQHLPHSSTVLFRMIQQLCRIIFSTKNTFLSWGDVLTELRPFQRFSLFNLSDVVHFHNLQNIFTNWWNINHPHTRECLDRYEPPEAESEDYLICLINSADLEDEFNTSNPHDDFNNCLCSDSHRPYKARKSIWSLQKAVNYVFDQALDKSNTVNTWSCGLDTYLGTWYTSQDKHTRETLILYAINDIIAPTKIFFHLSNLSYFDNSSSNLYSLNSIMNQSSNATSSSFLIIADSHGKSLEPIITTSNYQIITHVISGLQWINPYNDRLCVRSLLLQSPLNSLLSSCDGVLFIIGTNAVRFIIAMDVIEQVKEVISLIREHHNHLNTPSSITVVDTFPCLKTTDRFSSIPSLLTNINTYNDLLHTLSVQLKFSYINLGITENHLASDHMHLHHQYKFFISDSIIKYFDDLLNKTQLVSHRKSRSTKAKKRRNHKRHDKLRITQRQFTLSRPIDSLWKLKILKEFLKYHHISYARLPEIHHHTLRLKFNNLLQQEQAEQILSIDVFNEHNFHQWTQTHSK